jgi:hypothetical protein
VSPTKSKVVKASVSKPKSKQTTKAKIVKTKVTKPAE